MKFLSFEESTQFICKWSKKNLGILLVFEYMISKRVLKYSDDQCHFSNILIYLTDMFLVLVDVYTEDIDL